MLRELRFPLLVLILAIPIPAIIFNHITFPLQLLASRIASDILPMLGVPVLQEGNVIQLPVMKLETDSTPAEMKTSPSPAQPPDRR